MSIKNRLSSASLGARIRALRIAAGLTQSEFAAKVGVSRSAVVGWETDRAGQVRDNWEQIAEALNTSLSYLVSGDADSLQSDERALVRLFRACTPENRSLLMLNARRLARR
jgi:transcriptional regulator with XRE-family HTH domain